MKKHFLSLSIMILLLGIVPAFAWETERPSAVCEINSREDIAGTDDEASVGLGVHILEYKENFFEGIDGAPPRDGVTLRIMATANTRKAITYDATVFNGLVNWVEATTPTGITGDNNGTWLTLPVPVRFYGGPGHPYPSGEYTNVWVSSNGFLSFDSSSVSPYPKQIPNLSDPNTLLAVYWSDLDLAEGSIKYFSDSFKFVVLWDNVLNKRNDCHQTFEVIIEYSFTPSLRGQSKITFLYKNVTWSSDAIVGIEDQEGYKGTMPIPYPQSGQGVIFTASQMSPEIKRIEIDLQKSDNGAEIDIVTDEGPSNMAPKGHNIKLKEETPDPEGTLEKAAKGYGSLLITSGAKAVLEKAYGVVIKSVGGLMFGSSLTTIELAMDYARSLSPLNIPSPDVKDAYAGDSLAFIKASADSIIEKGGPVDASAGIQVYWIFDDVNSQDHTLTISAELEYQSYTNNTVVPLSVVTPITLKILHEVEPKLVFSTTTAVNSLGVDDQEDLYKFRVEVSTNATIHVQMSPTDADFDLELRDANNNLVRSSINRGLGLPETIDYVVYETGDWYVRVVYYLLNEHGGLYSLQISTNYPSDDHPGGGGGNVQLYPSG